MDDRDETRREKRSPMKPENEPVKPREIPGGGRGTDTDPRSADTWRGPGTPRSGLEKVGTATTPRTGATTGGSTGTTSTSVASRSNQETRGSPRNASDEKGMPKRSGPE